jgi:hypothetical protein
VKLVDPNAQKAAKVADEVAAPPPPAAVAAAAAAAAAVPAEFNEDDEIAALLTAAQAALRNRDFEKTQRLLRAAQNLDPNHPKVRTATKGAEAVILGELRGQGVSESKVPKVAKC